MVLSKNYEVLEKGKRDCVVLYTRAILTFKTLLKARKNLLDMVLEGLFLGRQFFSAPRFGVVSYLKVVSKEVHLLKSDFLNKTSP